jgi:hypothetical protein
MTARDFCFWLQGFFELEEAGREPNEPSGGFDRDQVAIITRHLALVFAHDIDPAIEAKGPLTKEQLDAVHKIASTHVARRPPRDLVFRC